MATDDHDAAGDERGARRSRRRFVAVARDGQQVRPLELFFDLVFVLALTQCTALMAAQPTWAGVGEALLVLAVLWWSWVGYAWLTSVVDPEEGAVRIAIFVAMAASLVAALCVPEAFGDLALTLAVAYAVVRTAHIALFVLASRDDPGLRRSVAGLAVSTALGVGLLTAAAFTDGALQAGLWIVALLLDMGGPLLFRAEGWRLEPAHFVERHGLVIIVALGEAIVAIGVGAEVGVDAGVVTAAVLGVALAAAMWWWYFDVGALLAGRRLEGTPPGRERNELARDAYSFLHLPMVAGVVLLALGVKKMLAHVTDPLDAVPAVALVGGLALYLLALVAFKYRAVRVLSLPRVLAAVALLTLVPVATVAPGLVTLAAMAVVAWGLVVFESVRYAEARDAIRHEVAHQDAIDDSPAV